MSMNPFRKKTELQLRQEAADAKLAELKLRSDVEKKEGLLLKLEEQEKYRTGSPSVQARIAAKRERAEFLEGQKKRQEQAVVSSLSRIGEGLTFLTAAKKCEEPQVTATTLRSRIGESMLEEFSYMPFDYGFLGGIIGKLYQVQGLIRELYPYKPTILRYIQQLDFARWACRVLYEECPTAKGLVKGKTNFVIRRGLKCKVIRKDKGTETSTVQKTAQKYVDQFREENEFSQKEMERYRRRMIDGEAFMHVFFSQDNVTKANPFPSCEVEFIEPDFVRPSQKGLQGQEDPNMSGQDGEDWSFGIHTPRHRYYKPLAYQIVRNDNTEVKIDAKYITHSAERERSNIKRCLPPLLSASDDLIRLTVLRAALAESSKFRAAIGGVIKYEEASQAAIETIDDIYGRSLSGCSGEDEVGYHAREWEAKSHANILELAPGRDFMFPTETFNPDALGLIYDWHIWAIAQQFQVPEWLVKGASAGASFADSLTAESPSVVEFENEQAIECCYTRRAVCQELQYRVDQKKLPDNFFEDYELDVQSDSVITRDSKAETETAVLQVQNQFNSLYGARASLGLDPEKVETQIAAEKQLGLGPVWSAEAREGRSEQPEKKQVEEGSPQTTDGQRQKLEGE